MKRFLTALFAILLLAQPANAALIHHWEFTEGTGTTAVATVGGRTLNLGTGASWVAGRVGTWALAFDGTTTNGKAVAGGGEIGATTQTACVWIKWTAHATFNVPWGGPTAASAPYIFAVDSTTIYSHDGVNFSSVAHGGLTNGVWFHICVSRAGTAFSFYKNGAQVGTTQTNASNNSSKGNTIGQKGDNTNPCTCAMDDAKIWDTAFNAAAILAEYQTFAIPSTRQAVIIIQ